MSADDEIVLNYAACLRRYLAQPGEENLNAAYELGRRALNQGAGIVDVIADHNDAINRITPDDPLAIPAATNFLLECLAPFEMAFRGFQDANHTLRLLNAELEQRIDDRTHALADANAELEAFAYSVSHDLRAPLRAIDGFSQVLLEDYADTLDEQGKRYVDRVRTAAQHMGKLIDDVLHLSRLSRAELQTCAVDLSTLARETLQVLSDRDPDRHVELLIADGLIAHGDPTLLRSLLENLLGNAWKFTTPHQTARIEFGATRPDGEPVYFVRDDGVGFDMAYADKLFTPFERLHGADAFPGTGVGLASAARIVRRHGGRIRAEAKPEKGATFHFTLAPDKRSEAHQPSEQPQEDPAR